MPPLPPMGPAVPATAIAQDTWAGVLEVMVSLIEQGLGWRANHSATVSQLVWQSAAQAGLQGTDAFNVRLAALLHEIGKPFDRHLTLLSINALQDHRAAASAAYHEPVRLFSHTNPPEEVLQILGAMYERFDGAGVPGKMSGQQIPVGARLLAVVDAYCDMIANPAAPGGHCPNHQLAVQRLTEAAGRGLLDPQMVNILAHLPTTIQETGRQTGDRPLILVVDEDVRSATVLEGKLKSSGFDAVVVSTPGDAALSLLGENVSLVVSEVELKPMDGFNFLEWLRSNERTSKIPFMFISARAGAEDVNRGFELGALDYIVKPFRPEVVVAKIKRILGS
jgi:response regulator RpfG family c-di-GMP phosphodiesterase